MILPSFILNSRCNKTFLTTGIDSEDKCRDKKWFKNYPHEVTYNYNSRGFRDSEWPDDHELADAIWCFGDSFTVGLGNNFKHTWTQLLSEITGRRTINISLDGASNNWLHRQAKEIFDTVKPHAIVMHWTYLSRYEKEDATLSDEDRRLHCHPFDWQEDESDVYQKRFNNFLSELNHSNIIHTAIPNYRVWHGDMNFILPVDEVVFLDIARDGYHYGQRTAKSLVDKISSRLETI